MTTSLAEQLQRLAIPQTRVLVDSKKRASLLFDPSEAAKLSKETVFQIGRDGLSQLIEMDPNFKKFEVTLFKHETQFIERTVESKEVNKKLDKLIAKFMFRLSPYLLLKPAHMALEWLIYRYHIHYCNVTELFALIMPYHRTNIFVKLLQIADLKSSVFKSWDWLTPIRRNGVQLTSETLENHLKSDTSFLRFICDYMERVLKEHRKTNTEGKLKTQFAFYMKSLCSLFLSGPTNDQILTIVLPSLFNGFDSSVPDYKASVYSITATLIAKNQLEQELAAKLLQKILYDSKNVDKQRRFSLIMVFFQYQHSTPPLSFEDIKDCGWITSYISEKKSSFGEILVGNFVKTLVQVCLEEIFSKEGSSEYAVDAQVMCWGLLKEIECESTSLLGIFRVLTTYHEKPTNDKKKQKLSSSENDDNGIANWLNTLIEFFMTKYECVLDQFKSPDVQKFRRQWMGEKLEEAKDSQVANLVRRCSAANASSSWKTLKPLLLKYIDNINILKAWYQVAPPDEPLNILLAIEKILEPSTSFPMAKVFLVKISEFHKANNELLSALKSIFETTSKKTISDALAEMLETIWLTKGSNLYSFTKWINAIKELRTTEKFSHTNNIWLYAYKMLVAILPSTLKSYEIISTVDSLLGITTLSPIHQLDIINCLLEKVSTIPYPDEKWCDVTQFQYPVYLKLKIFEMINVASFKADHKNRKLTEKYAHLLDRLVKSFKNGTLLPFLGAVFGGLQPPPFPKDVVVPMCQMSSCHYIWKYLKEPNDLDANTMSQLICYIFLAMNSNLKMVRSCAMKLLKHLSEKDDLPCLNTLVKQLVLRSEEIVSDPDQLSVALYCLLSPEESVQKSLNKKLSASLAEDRERLFAILNSPEIPFYVVAKMMILLESVTSKEILKNLAVSAKRALDNQAHRFFSNAVVFSYWQRLTVSTATALADQEVWRLAVDSLAHDKCDQLSPAIGFLKVVKKELFAELNEKQQEAMLDVLIKTRAETESPAVATAVATVCRKIVLDGKIILRLLDKKIGEFPRDSQATPSAVLESKSWRFVIALLELIQNKKKMRESRVLMRSLFDVLKFCLDQEEQTTFEYAKQLVLSCLLEICERHNAGGETIETSVLNVELIIQCLRASWNPQTHHHALLLLSCLGSIIPVQVMHNMMAIFTFMGSSVARLDDEHSVQVVAKVVDTIVPVLVQSLPSETGGDAVVAEVLRIFVWTLRDVPIHRRTPLFSRLISTLDPDRSLWIFLLLLFENYVSSYQGNKNNEGNMPPSLQLGMELSLSFGPKVVLNTTLKLINYLIQIPIDKMSPIQSSEMLYEENDLVPDGLFDISKHSPKQLRHYAYTLITFLSSMLSDQNLILQVRELDSSDSECLEIILKDAIAALLLYTPLCAKQQQIQLAKFWKSMVNLGHDVLDRLVALVSSDTLSGIITRLLEHNAFSLRKKAMDLLNVHIQSHRGGFTNGEKSSLKKLVEPILHLAIETISVSTETTLQDSELIQQTALLSMRLLAKVLAADEPDSFKQVLANVSKLCRSKGNLLASAVLTVADLVAYLKVRAVPELPNYLPAILKAFHKYINSESTDLILMSLSAALYRIVESLAAFLSPYMDKLLYSVCCIASKWPDAGDLNRKLHQIRQKIATIVPHRVLIPSLSRCYTRLIEESRMLAVGPLLSVLADSLSSYPEVSKLLPDLSPFFIQVLQIRSDAAENTINVSDEEVLLVETFAIDALLSLVLKLSELSFKPLYYQIFHWVSEHPHRAITFYRLSSKLAEGLKGLFVLFAGHFLQNAASLLDKLNVTKNEKPFFGDGSAAESKAILLLESIIHTLHTVFLFDSTNFLSKDKFQALLHPLVDQLDNTLGGPEKLEERSNRLLIPCLSQMTLATDDIQWKALNYQLLTKTRSTSPMVRIAALKTVVEIAAKLGEDYLPLLPETIGSLAELLEDEDERVEEAMKEALRRMEDDLGQPIKEYFQ